jgi:uncharacterized protein YecE (DUF72 family)
MIARRHARHVGAWKGRCALTAAEVNSSFHRPHRPATWGRWARTVGPSFRFAVKVPKAITHERRLVDVEPLVEAFLAEPAPLGGKLGPLLVQLPPSLAFDRDTVARVAADPAVVPRAAEPGGWPELRYFRLHGSPVTYRSAYPPEVLDAVAARLRPGDWCMFDNTAAGEALGNALGLLSRLRPS